jgi:hypothetical protein
MRTTTIAAFLACALAGAVTLGGCANKYDALTPELQAKFMDDLKSGKPTLDCGQQCRLTWVAQVPAIHQLDLAESWAPLADKVMQIGFGNDLAYYYLGQAAQGLGFHQAAISYYDTSLALATGTNPLLKCSGLQNNLQTCQGVDLVASIPVLVQASKDVLAKQEADAAAAAASETPPPVTHHKHPKAVATNASGWSAPPPATPASSASAAPASGSSGSGWSAPPPPPSQ